jgi:dTDP-4-amino-4,6-dideoxygalactose transaminase
MPSARLGRLTKEDITEVFMHKKQNHMKTIGVGTCNISAAAKKNVLRVLESNRLTYGPFSQQFEQLFGSAHDCDFAVFVNSGTSALRIALAALKEKYGWKDGDEVIIPSLTFIADYNVIVSNRLTPVFCDVHSREYVMDPDLLEKRITAKTRAIMPTHLFGLSADMRPLLRIAKKHNLRVVEDACEASFTEYRGKPVGAFGDISCFSTYQAHILTTGVGGFALTNDQELAVLLRSLANHGRDNIYIQIDDDKNKSEQEMQEIIGRRFSFVRPGFSFRATELEAAIGVAEMKTIQKELARRRAVAQSLTRILTPYKNHLQLPIIPKGRRHVFMMYPIVVRNPAIRRDDLLKHLELNGIETRFMLPMTNQPFVQKIHGDLSHEFPVADFINKNGFYIGSHSDMRRPELDRIRKTFHSFFASV